MGTLISFVLLAGSVSGLQDRSDFLGKWISSTNLNSRIYVVKEQDTYVFRFLFEGVVTSSKPGTFAQGAFTVDDIIDHKFHLENNGTILVADGQRYRRLGDEEAKRLNDLHAKDRERRAEVRRKEIEAQRNAARQREVERAIPRVKEAVYTLDKRAYEAEAKSFPEAISGDWRQGLILSAGSKVNAPLEVKRDFMRFMVSQGYDMNRTMPIYHNAAFDGNVLHQLLWRFLKAPDYDFAVSTRKTDISEGDLDEFLFLLSLGANPNTQDTRQLTVKDYLDVGGMLTPPSDWKNLRALIRKLDTLGSKTVLELSGAGANKGSYGLVPLANSPKFLKNQYDGKVLALYVMAKPSRYIAALQISKHWMSRHSSRGLQMAIIVPGKFAVANALTLTRDHKDDVMRARPFIFPLYLDSDGTVGDMISRN
jgi:hypothetical protein